MPTSSLLVIYLAARFTQHLAERALATTNRRYYEDENRRREAQKLLDISDDMMIKTLAYSRDKFRFGSFSAWVSIAATLAFLGLGGLGILEKWAVNVVTTFGGGEIMTGLAFFALAGLCSWVLGLPFDLYHTFVLEEKHGFNRQTTKGFISDQIKGLLLAALLGGLVLALILWIMEKTGHNWWVYAWLAMFTFSLLTAWIYPTLLAPLFNRFKPLDEGELKDKIFALAKEIEFKADSISIMDASRRSTHGNAYFTGVFGKKKIVLFDNLVKSMNTDEIVAVLAHELGHFKLHHIRWSLIRSFFITGIIFYLLSLMLPNEVFYRAFDLKGISNYGALTVFSLWFGLVSFLLQPLSNYISRRNEFAADAFALKYTANNRELGNALLKLRETSNVMPISHPVFSTVYLSHPPLLERLKAMAYLKH